MLKVGTRCSEFSASRCGRFTLRESALGTNGTGGWVSHILQPSRSSISWSRHSHRTGWATPAAGADYALHKTLVLWTSAYVYTCICRRWRSVLQWRIAAM